VWLSVQRWTDRIRSRRSVRGSFTRRRSLSSRFERSPAERGKTYDFHRQRLCAFSRPERRAPLWHVTGIPWRIARCAFVRCPPLTVLTFMSHSRMTCVVGQRSMSSNDDDDDDDDDDRYCRRQRVSLNRYYGDSTHLDARFVFSILIWKRHRS